MSCPLPSESAEIVMLSQGEGGRLSRVLLDRIDAWLGNPSSRVRNDAALLDVPHGRLAFTCDSYVVTPLFFPGGDIGKLAVFGTVNDLAVSAARPLGLSLSLIIEDGFALSQLERVVKSVALAAAAANVRVMTGDTKVVPRGNCDGLFVHTSGIGLRLTELAGSQNLSVGDVVIVSGPIGRHGVAVLAARESLAFEPPPESDCGCLVPAVQSLLDAGVPVKAMRDATRGGVAAVLHEWTADCGQSIVLDQENVPVTPVCRGVAELLGLDLLHVASEGTMVVAVDQADANAAVTALRSVEISADAVIIGCVEPRGVAPVAKRQPLGTRVAVDEPAGAPLPRIC